MPPAGTWKSPRMCGASSAAMRAPAAAPSVRTMRRDLAKAGAMLPLRRLGDHPQADRARGRAGGEPVRVVPGVVHGHDALAVDLLVDLGQLLLHRPRVEGLPDRPHRHGGNEAFDERVRWLDWFHAR